MSKIIRRFLPCLDGGPIDPVEPGDGADVAKYAASATHPIIILWNHAPLLGTSHPSWTHKNIWVNAKASFNGYYPIPGYPNTASTLNQYNTGSYNTLNSATDLLDITDEQLEAKLEAHAEFDSWVIVHNQHKQGLIRGKGPIGGGDYGGSWTHHEMFSVGRWQPNAAHHSFTNIFTHPADAALIARTQDLKTSAGTTRPSKLFKTDCDGSPGNIQTKAARQATEATTTGYRPANYYSLICTNGIAQTKRYCDKLIAKVKAKCDAYTIPAGLPNAGNVVQLCYPAYILNDFEDFFGLIPHVAHSFINSTDTDDLLEHPGPHYWHIGVFYHLRGDPLAPSSLFTNHVIFQKPDGNGGWTDVTMRDAYLAESELASFVTAYSPGILSGGNFSSRGPGDVAPFQNHGVDQAIRITRHTFDYAVFKALLEPWKAAMPLTVSSNYDAAIVVNDAYPYQRVSAAGSGTLHIQKISRHEHQAPSCYGDYGDTDGFEACHSISDPVAKAAAIEAERKRWNAANFDRVLAVVDTLDQSIPMDIYLWGADLVSKVVAGQLHDFYGGDREFFKNTIKGFYNKGFYRFAVFAGDVDEIYAGFTEALADIEAGNLAITWAP